MQRDLAELVKVESPLHPMSYQINEKFINISLIDNLIDLAIIHQTEFIFTFLYKEII